MKFNDKRGIDSIFLIVYILKFCSTKRCDFTPLGPVELRPHWDRVWSSLGVDFEHPLLGLAQGLL